MSEKRVCALCGEEYEERWMYEVNDEMLCEDCFHDNYAVCEICGDIEPIEDITYVDSECMNVCDYCLDRHFVECVCCGAVIRDDNIHWLEGEEYCERCFDDNAWWCDICHEYYTIDNYDVEQECCRECASRNIGEYHSHNFYKVGLNDFENNQFHKGVELEIENILEDIENDEMAEMLSRKYEHMVFERDGSLDNGFEIITQPHTLKEFDKIPWDEIFHICKNNGFRSHDTSTCGMHIHYSREWFGTTKEEQDDNIGKLIVFYERHLDDILRVSRRTWGNYQRWARGYDTEGDIEKCKECAKGRNDRYRYINLTKTRTVEFRLGRGTLNYFSFMAWNNLHDCLVKNVRKVSYEDIDNLCIWFDGIDSDTLEYMKKKCAFIGFV